MKLTDVASSVLATTHVPVVMTVLSIIFGSLAVRVNAVSLETVVGSASPGFSGDSGPAKMAKLRSPYGVWMNPSRELFIADHGNRRIRKALLGGDISTIAGSSRSSFYGDGGPATSAGMSLANGVCGDTAGNIYAIEDDYRIRQVSPKGMIKTFAGTGDSHFGGDGGPATSASFSVPYSCTFDPWGNFYLATINNCRLRKVSAVGQKMTTIFGTGSFVSTGDGGQATSASYKSSASVYADSTGLLYVAEDFGYKVRRINLSTGIVTTFAGTGKDSFTGDGGPATAATLPGSFMRVTGDVYGNIFIAASDRMHRVDGVTKMIQWIAGKGTAGFDGGDELTGTDMKTAQFNRIQQMATLDGNVWMPEIHNHVVRQLTYNPYPSVSPTAIPTETPTIIPTAKPTVVTSVIPTETPSVTPTVVPTVTPTVIPTVVPTRRPSVVPTLEPTALPTEWFAGVKINATLDIEDVELEQPDDDYYFNQAVRRGRRLARAGSMVLMEVSDQAIITTVAGILGLSEHAVTVRSENVTVNSISRTTVHVELSILAPARDYPVSGQHFKSYDACFNFFSNKFSTAVDTQEMYNQLLVVAANTGAHELYNVTSVIATSVSNQEVVDTRPPSPDNDADDRSDGDFTGIVIGVVVGLLVIIALVYFCVYRCCGAGGVLKPRSAQKDQEEKKNYGSTYDTVPTEDYDDEV